MSAEGIGLHAVVFIDEDDDLAVALIHERLGEASPREIAARDLLEGELAEGTPEMLATLLERLAELVPVECEDGGVATDVAGLVRVLREGAMLS